MHDDASEHEPLRPGQALLHPLWLIALVVLVANDHWLKYAELLPGAVTGKLSDVAGLVVAPSLLALLLGVRRRRALLGCHVAIGLVFAGIQLSPGFAGLWSAAMGLLGYPWTITCDVTDLLTSPALGLSWVVLGEAMSSQRAVTSAARRMTAARRSAVAGLAVLGLWSTVATTEGPESEPRLSPVVGNLAINNAGDVDIALHLRFRREDVRLDCAAVAEDPGRLLSGDAFGEAEHWLLPPQANIGVELAGDPCDAVWVAGDGIEPSILFVDTHSNPPISFEGTTSREELETREAMLGLVFGEDGRADWIGDTRLRFTPRSDPPGQPVSCEQPTGEQRIVWSDNVPEHAAEILALEAGVDGCFEFQLQEWVLVDSGPEIMAWQSPYLWYLCAPEAAVPFAVGEFFGSTVNVGAGGTTELQLLLLDPDNSLLAMTNAEGRIQRSVRLLHGGHDPQFIGPALSRELEAVPASACAWMIEPGCATAERNAELRVVGANSPIAIDSPISFADPPGNGALLHTLVLAYVRERAVVDEACSTGTTALRHDIDLAVIDEPLL